MKVSEILNEQQMAVTEENLSNRLKGFDWNYDLSDDFRRQKRGQQAMNVLEGIVYQFWKTNPDRAVELWNRYSPGGRPGIIPSFIFRFQSQETK